MGVWNHHSTAPKDGRTFLLCLPRMMNLVVRCRYDTVHKQFTTDMETDGGITRVTFFHDNEDYGPDLWTEIPEPPAWKPKFRKVHQ